MNSSWTCENDDSSDQTAIIATFPSPGKLPAFCRKRRCSVSAAAAAAKIDSSAKPTKNPVGNSAIERFLEGRERLLFVGRLLFAFLVLLSPGYFFPLLFFIRTYCHFWKHNASVDQEEEVFERTHRLLFQSLCFSCNNPIIYSFIQWALQLLSRQGLSKVQLPPVQGKD
jgi:hypothetical protein